MTENEFNHKFKGVNAPSCRGAKQPAFNPAKINESKFADELRFKDVNFDFIDGKDAIKDTVHINWVSYSWPDDGAKSLVEEIKRCFKFIGFKGIVALDVCDRDEDDDDYIEFEIT